MSPRAALWTFLAGVLGVVALIVSVWMVGERAADSIRASEAKARSEEATRVLKARVEQTQTLRAGCARAVARDYEAWETNRDLRDFARDAAVARRASGDHGVARGYDATARRAERRMDRIRVRLPAREDAATISAFCRVLYPEPPVG